ncbi:MAG: response regulator [Gemmatimonas sp.]|nr:response regulator [Gemmatimonas sp.]
MKSRTDTKPVVGRVAPHDVQRDILREVVPNLVLYQLEMARIIFAEDDEAMRFMVTDVLTAAGHTVIALADGRSVVALVRADPPDLVVLDYRMGAPDGFEVCRQIKDDPRLEHVPVLLLTAEHDVEDRIEGFEAGADDYLPKPFDARELVARVRALLRLSERGRGLNPTTGLPGGASIEREFERRRMADAPFTLCYLDLDHFKAFNDRFGFATANALIEDVGRILRQLVAGSEDFAGHIGGDDFVIICSPSAARPLVERAQKLVVRALSRYVGPEILRKGAYAGRLRDGQEAQVPLTGLAAALLHLDPGTMPPLMRLGEMAADAKQLAKQAPKDGVVEVWVTD